MALYWDYRDFILSVDIIQYYTNNSVWVSIISIWVKMTPDVGVFEDKVWFWRAFFWACYQTAIKKNIFSL